MPDEPTVDRFADPDPGELIRFAVDQLHYGAKWDHTAGHFTAATAYALTSIAVSLARLAHRYAARPTDFTNVYPVHDDR